MRSDEPVVVGNLRIRHVPHDQCFRWRSLTDDAPARGTWEYGEAVLLHRWLAEAMGLDKAP